VGEKNNLDKVLIVVNGCSGEYDPAFSNNSIHVASFSKSITTYKSFLAHQRSACAILFYCCAKEIGNNPDLIDAPQTDIAQAL
jgi:hypothetical protein